MSDLSRRPGETELAYILRLGTDKETGLIDMTWRELADVMNKNLRSTDERPFGESVYRKKFANIKQFRNEFGTEVPDANAQELIELRRELEKEKIKIRDERTEYRRLIREEARKESYMEQFVRSIETAAGRYALNYSAPEGRVQYGGNAAMLIPLYDIHAGLESRNYWNDFDENILKKRMNHYLDKVFEIRERHEVDSAYVVISESLSGLIHNSLRLENNQDLIEQFLMVTDYLCDFIANLSSRFATIHVYVAPGNHSRITAKKEDSLDHENMDYLLIPFIRARLQNLKNVFCHNNDMEPATAIFNIFQYSVAALHGDKDSPQNAADHLRGMYGRNFDICLMGHRHTNALVSDGDCKVVQTGCMSGTDSYAVSIRKHNRPEQAVCVITEADGLDCIYDVKF